MQPLTPIDVDKDNHEIQYDRSVATTFKNLSFGNLVPSTSPTLGTTLVTTNVDNMSGYWWLGTSSASMTIPHNLGRVPTGFIVASKSAACDVYEISATSTNIVLGANTAGVSLKIFVLG